MLKKQIRDSSKRQSRLKVNLRPSPATAISIVALLVALSGSAYAATGGNFILGGANTASKVSSLANKKGTALSLSSMAGTPSLTVNSAVQVPNLNASLLGGSPSSSFVMGGGTMVSGTQTVTSGNKANIVSTPDNSFTLQGECDPFGKNSGAAILVVNNSQQSLQVDILLDTYGNNFISGGALTIPAGSGSAMLPANDTTGGGIVFMQGVSGSRILTMTASATYTSGSPNTCVTTAEITSSV
jgi:hypothetical protein